MPLAMVDGPLSDDLSSCVRAPKPKRRQCHQEHGQADQLRGFRPFAQAGTIGTLRRLIAKDEDDQHRHDRSLGREDQRIPKVFSFDPQTACRKCSPLRDHIVELDLPGCGLPGGFRGRPRRQHIDGGSSSPDTRWPILPRAACESPFRISSGSGSAFASALGLKNCAAVGWAGPW